MINKDFDVLAVGELNPDLIFSDVTGTPTLGREILAGGFHLRLGSSTAIAAAQMASLGLKAALVSCVGDDSFGVFCRQELVRMGVDTRHVIVNEQASTGLTVSITYPEDRMLVTHLGAIAHLRNEHVTDEMLDSARHLHVSALYLQEGLSPGCGDLFRRAKEKGMTVSLDTGDDPADTWDGGVHDLLKKTDLFFPNKREIVNLGKDADPERAADNIREPGLIIAAKLGADGCLLVSDKKRRLIRGFSVTPIDTTGAGDSFDAGFLAGFVNGLSIEECCGLGNACGALSTQYVGGPVGLRHFEEVRAWIDQQNTDAS